MQARSDARSSGHWQGMNWIRQERRLAIYLRDGLACVYCGAAVEDGTILTLDHVIPHSLGGSNAATNLVTCCHRCNSSRGNRSLPAFARAVAHYLNHGVTPKTITSHVETCTGRALDVAAAKRLIALRGSAARVLAAERKRS
jgi:hypothetical protein